MVLTLPMRDFTWGKLPSGEKYALGLYVGIPTLFVQAWPSHIPWPGSLVWSGDLMSW